MTFEEAEATIRNTLFKHHEQLGVYECELLTSMGYIARGIAHEGELYNYKEISRMRAVSKILEIENNRGKE